MALNVPDFAPNAVKNEEGLWVTPVQTKISYPESGNEFCFAVEDSSFWFKHRNNVILQALKSFRPPGAFFDVGGGNGYVARAVQASGVETVLIEPGLIGARNAAQRGVRHVIHGSLQDTGFLAGTMPAIGLFDVIEHVEDACSLLETLRTLQTPGGRLYITVPAWPWLWSHEDELAGHFRRYSPASLTHTLREGGYEVELVSCFFEFLVLPIFALRVIPYRLGFGQKPETAEHVRSDHDLQNPFAKRIYNVLTRRELSRIADHRSIRTGASCLAVARRL